MNLILAIRRFVQELRGDPGPGYISDGCGNWWPSRCPKCGGEMQVQRPGWAECRFEREPWHGRTEEDE